MQQNEENIQLQDFQGLNRQVSIEFKQKQQSISSNDNNNNISNDNKQQKINAELQKLIQIDNPRSQNVFLSKKVFQSAQEALFDLQDGMTALFSGFGISGIPENSIEEIKRQGIKNITAISSTGGTIDWGVGVLFGQLEIEIVPLGSFAEKIRCGGAGIPAFYTPTGVGTQIENGNIPQKYNQQKQVVKYSSPKEVKQFKGKNYIMEESLTGDFAFIKAKYGDELGNLYYFKTANNFNQDMATAARITIAEVEEIVPSGSIDPDLVHTPSIYVDRIYKGSNFAKKIEKLKFDNDPSQQSLEQSLILQKKISITEKLNQSGGLLSITEKIAQRAAKELRDGMYVNLGVGIPTLIPRYIDKNIHPLIHSENGVLGVGKYPLQGQQNSELINASRETITLVKGASNFSGSSSFSMIRGGHLDITFLGALQVSKYGDLANWMIPDYKFNGMGGAMDLVTSGSKVVVCMQHINKVLRLGYKLVDQCGFPLTGVKCVDMVITNMAVFVKMNGELTLTEIAQGYTLQDIIQATGFQFKMVPLEQIQYF